MKRIIFSLRLLALATTLAVGAGLSACNKETDFQKQLRQQEEAARKTDDDAIQAYLKRHNITDYTRTESGLYLVTLAENTSVTEKIKSGQRVTTNYVGRFIGETTENAIFDASSNNRTACGCLSFTVGANSVVKGWEEAILLMKKGDRKLLLIPSHLGYGAQAQGNIPPFTPLSFDIEVLDVQ